MRLAVTAIAVLALAACGKDAGDKGAGPPPGPSQIEAVTFGLGSDVPGKRLYGRECAFCHVGKNTGAMMLKRRLPEGEPAQLDERKDLTADYVKAVVRNGLVNMPPLSRVELSDADLDAIANWLADPKK